MTKKPSEQEIVRILKATGKYRPEHELNCGAAATIPAGKKRRQSTTAWPRFTCAYPI